MKKILLTFAFGIFSILLLNAQQKPTDATMVIREAVSQAKVEGKRAFIIFTASWCGWCHRMNAALNDSACKKYFDDNFVIRHLIVSETREKKHLENPGADSLMEHYATKRSGIPFWLILDSESNLLLSSMMPSGENSGCPATEKEVDYFIGVLKRTTALSPQALKIIYNRFRQNETGTH